jgi:hypothetical protein
MTATEQQIIRRSTRLLAAVHELHKQGYQNLAIYTGMSSSGFHWRLQLCDFYDLTLCVGHLNEPIEPLQYELTLHSSGEATYTLAGKTPQKLAHESWLKK